LLRDAVGTGLQALQLFEGGAAALSGEATCADGRGARGLDLGTDRWLFDQVPELWVC
jgi:hypothetical protein